MLMDRYFHRSFLGSRRGLKFGKKRFDKELSMNYHSATIYLGTPFNFYSIIKHSSFAALSKVFLGLTPITHSR